MRHAVIVAILIAGLVTLVSGKIITIPYYYDEADYMFAASLGCYANWIDAGSMPISNFIRIGLNRGTDSSQRAALSQLARSSTDPVVYRHWHGPLYYYWLAALSKARLHERTVRSLSLTFPVLTVIILYFSTLWIVPAAAAQPAAILSSALFLWNQMTVRTTEVVPHMLFVLCYVPALLLLAKYVSDGRRRYWYGAVVFTGLAFCTLEVAFVLVATLLVCAYLYRKKLQVDWGLARNSALVLLLTILLIWPAAVVKLSFLKAYLSMAYFAIFRKGAWGDVGFVETWVIRFTNSPLEWVAVAGSLMVFFATRLWRSLPAAVPLAVYGLFMLVALLRVNTEGPRYMAPFFPALVIFVGWTGGYLLAQMKFPVRWQGYVTVVAVCASLFLITRAQLAGYLLREDPYPQAMLVAVREGGFETKTLLVPQMYMPTLHYYFPRGTFHPYLELADIPRLLAAGRFDAVLYPEYPVRLKSPATSAP
jgi:Dolichyl-phosphate-mannose-protein mannosyltransferase